MVINALLSREHSFLGTSRGLFCKMIDLNGGTGRLESPGATFNVIYFFKELFLVSVTVYFSHHLLLKAST
jgi:hypothetical protein